MRGVIGSLVILGMFADAISKLGGQHFSKGYGRVSKVGTLSTTTWCSSASIRSDGASPVLGPLAPHKGRALRTRQAIARQRGEIRS